MNSRRWGQITGGAYLIATLTGWGCLSIQNQTSLGGATDSSTLPYTEAYIEYPGPQEKWSGPSSFLLHVVAKDAGPVQIVMTPVFTKEPAKEVGPQAPTSVTRAPASAPAAALAMTTAEAREHLSTLASALQGPASVFKGCMSPVRVRLVRTDGALVEKQGCRSDLGWSRTVSNTVAAFMESSVNGAR
jgi:hypothetical protein